MSVAGIAKSLLPERVTNTLIRARKRVRRARIARLPVLNQEDFKRILVSDLGLAPGQLVYLHTSVDRLNLGFEFYQILPLIREAIGPQGTIVLPTYPNRTTSSLEFLEQGELFDIRKTPAYTGLLNEFARRQKGAVRSLHPTKSVCAIGPLAAELTREHHLSPYPYDSCSPYYKLIDYDAKIIGLGVGTEYLSFVYVIDDALKENAPVRTYDPRVFEAKCIDGEGHEVVVRTYGHDMAQVVHDIPRFIKRYVPPEICVDLRINGMKFFRADAPRLFEVMLNLAKQGITVYPSRR